MSDGLFGSSVRSAGDLAGVFEHDGETGYFYLYDQRREEGRKVLDSIRVLNFEPDFDQEDVVVQWDESESKTGLFIRGELWAVFDTQAEAKYGGDYRPGTRSVLPTDIISSFAGA